METIDGPVTDHGVVLDVKDIPWAGRQLWDCDCTCKDGKYYMYFPLKDQTDIFRIGVAVADKPEGPFIPQPDPMKGSYSIDPAILDDGDGNYYMYFGGLCRITSYNVCYTKLLRIVGHRTLICWPPIYMTKALLIG